MFIFKYGGTAKGKWDRVLQLFIVHPFKYWYAAATSKKKDSWRGGM